MYRNGDVSSCAKLEVSEGLQGKVSEHRRISQWTNSTWKDDPSENKRPEFHIIICLMEPWRETKQQMSQNSLGGCQDCKIAAGTTIWDRVCGGKGRNGTEKGLDPSGHPWFSAWGWGEGGCFSERTDGWVSLVSHREESSASYSLKNKKKRRDLCLLLPDTIAASRIWKQTRAVAWHTIKALHVHRRGKKMYPKNSLLVTENLCVSAWVTVKVSLMTAHLLRISVPAQPSPSHPLHRVHLPPQRTLNQFYDFSLRGNKPLAMRKSIY